MTGQILLVEDEEHLARGLKFNLEAEGYKTRVAGDGETALDLLLQQHAEFDLVVLDVMLPGKDGFTVAAELRKANHFIPLGLVWSVAMVGFGAILFAIRLRYGSLTPAWLAHFLFNAQPFLILPLFDWLAPALHPGHLS